MQVLQQAIESAFDTLPELWLAALIRKKLAAKGVECSKADMERLVQHVRSRSDKPFRIRRSGKNRQITIEFTQEEIDEAQKRLSGFIQNGLPEVVQKTTRKMAKEVLRDLKRKWPAESRFQRRELEGFRKRLYRRWRTPLERLAMLLTMSRELGEWINGGFAASPDPSRKNLIYVLTRSHARACQITDEIYCLLAAGFADGAMARWRTLYELTVTCEFLADGGEELATRYLAHDIVESHRPAYEYEECRGRLGYKPLSKAYLRKLDRSFQRVIAKYGGAFQTQYGWAAAHLGKPRLSFTDIEKAIGAAHFRSHYRLASHNVHANPKGIFFRLGLLRETQMLLAGASNAGLVEPGHATALMLTRISATLCCLRPSLDNNVALSMLGTLVQEIGGAFLEAHKRLETDETAITEKIKAPAASA